jgi:hypothetical protein
MHPRVSHRQTTVPRHANNGSGDTPIGRNIYPPAPERRRCCAGQGH